MPRPRTRLFADASRAVRLWRVWLFLGLQDVKARFRRSFIGPLWILLNLGLFVGGAGVVYGLMFQQPMGDFLPLLTAGFVIWGFLVSSLTESGLSFVVAEGYIKQFAYPKQIYLLRVLVGYTVTLLFGLSALVPLQIVFGRFHPIGWLAALPGLAVLLLAALGHITICGYLGARFRDLPHALGGVLQVMFFVTPILFPVSQLRLRHLDFVYLFNPLYYLIDIVRGPLLTTRLSPVSHYEVAGAYVLIVWGMAVVVARRFDARVVFLL